MSNCDKCGKPVPVNNSAAQLDALMGAPNAIVVAIGFDRHLVPVDGCEGSPSRAQYLRDQPRDTRGYPYHPGLEAPIREAFERLQEVTADPCGERLLDELT